MFVILLLLFDQNLFSTHIDDERLWKKYNFLSLYHCKIYFSRSYIC